MNHLMNEKMKQESMKLKKQNKKEIKIILIKKKMKKFNDHISRVFL